MNKRFFAGFFIGLLVFICINLLAAHLTSDCGLIAVFERGSCADDIARAGWPLQFYEKGGFAYRSEFSLASLLLNLGFGLGASLLAGWLSARRKSSPPK